MNKEKARNESDHSTIVEAGSSRELPKVEKPYEPALNIPAFVTIIALVMIAIHAVRSLLLSRDQDIWSLLMFAFIPARYGAAASDYPMAAASLWTPFTYAFLHADWTHLLMNLLWLAAFGSPLARRLGSMRLLALTVVTAVAGAVLHYVFFVGDPVPVIGASAIVSGYMGAAARFAFRPSRRGLNVEGPALTLLQSFTDRRFLMFFGVWFVLNFAFGNGFVSVADADRQVAWQAHAGGFLAGIFLFSLFDRAHFKRG